MLQELLFEEVDIQYTAFCEGVLLDSSKGEPVRFILGRGEVMEAWDRIVGSMRKAWNMYIDAIYRRYI